MADSIDFLLNDQPVRLSDIRPNMTVLDWLRGPAGCKGTKEGCAEGDCGACTILIERLSDDGAVERRPATSCILLLGQIDGLGIRTIDRVAENGSAADHLQQAFADGGGTQCGFCTPGFVMSAQALLEKTSNPSETEIHDAIAGNLCRCTGYRPIVDAIQKAGETLRLQKASAAEEANAPGKLIGARLAALPAATGESRAFEVGGARFYAPRNLDEAISLRGTHPTARLYCGGTDLGLLAGRDRRPPSDIISLANVAELNRIVDAEDALSIGAAVPYAMFIPHINRAWPELATYLSRLGSTQIRSIGTLGGNLGTASPIGDMLPLLLALDAEIILRSADGSRTIPMTEFVTGYRRNALVPGEIIAAVRLPSRTAGTLLFADKLSRRRDQDISALTAVFRLRLIGDAISDVRIAFGGMADRPVRVAEAEAALSGPCSLASFRKAAFITGEILAPRGDIRAPAAYRRRAAENLFMRLFMRVTDPNMAVELDDLRHG